MENKLKIWMTLRNPYPDDRDIYELREKLHQVCYFQDFDCGILLTSQQMNYFMSYLISRFNIAWPDVEGFIYAGFHIQVLTHDMVRDGLNDA